MEYVPACAAQHEQLVWGALWLWKTGGLAEVPAVIGARAARLIARVIAARARAPSEACA